MQIRRTTIPMPEGNVESKEMLENKTYLDFQNVLPCSRHHNTGSFSVEAGGRYAVVVPSSQELLLPTGVLEDLMFCYAMNMSTEEEQR